MNTFIIVFCILAAILAISSLVYVPVEYTVKKKREKAANESESGNEKENENENG